MMAPLTGYTEAVYRLVLQPTEKRMRHMWSHIAAATSLPTDTPELSPRDVREVRHRNVCVSCALDPYSQLVV